MSVAAAYRCVLQDLPGAREEVWKPTRRRREEAVSSSTTTVSFEQYRGNAAENYDRYFVPAIGMAFATALLDAAALHRGERVLDIACGTGVVTRLAADRVGPDGAVAGLDINPAMLAVGGAPFPPGGPVGGVGGDAGDLAFDANAVLTTARK